MIIINIIVNALETTFFNNLNITSSSLFDRCINHFNIRCLLIAACMISKFIYCFMIYLLSLYFKYHDIFYVISLSMPYFYMINHKGFCVK